VIAPYLDASAIIYLIEGAPPLRQLAEGAIAAAEQDPTGRLLTSHLARLECRVKPLRDGDAALLATYDAFFTRARVTLVALTGAAIDRATDLRARYGFKTPDAIHLAAAIEAGADGFVTGDAGLARCAEIKVAVVSPPTP
jgi:uncharacterized protein